MPSYPFKHKNNEHIEKKNYIRLNGLIEFGLKRTKEIKKPQKKLKLDLQIKLRFYMRWKCKHICFQLLVI